MYRKNVAKKVSPGSVARKRNKEESKKRVVETCLKEMLPKLLLKVKGRRCKRMLAKSVEQKCCNEVLKTCLVKTRARARCREVLKKCCKDVLWKMSYKPVGQTCCKDAL